MILHSLELTHVGRFRETVRVGPFCPGLNILSAPNESGKSTALHAAARTLFDRHTTKSEEIKALQPAGTSLAPRVTVEFQTGAGHFRIAKTFLQKPESRLSQFRAGAWELLAEADDADQRVQNLLQSSLPGRGATKPEHWGFLGFLWARQGEPALWPGLDDPHVGQRIRARLARVELDPVIEELRLRFAAAADAIMTSTGQSRVGGPLRSAEEDLFGIEAALEEIHKTRALLEETQRQYQQSEAEVLRLEKEHAEQSTVATALREQALATERLSGELTARQQALTSAKEKLAVLVTDAATLSRLQVEYKETEEGLVQARSITKEAEQALTELRSRLDTRQSELPGHEKHLQTLRSTHQRLRDLLKLRRLNADAGTLAKQVEKAEAASTEISALEARRTALPALTAAQLRKLEDQSEFLRTLRAQLLALGLTVELTPDSETMVENLGNPAAERQKLPAAQPHRLQSPSAMDLRLEGWGRVLIRSGSQDAQSAASNLAESETGLTEALQQAGVSSVDAAREAVATRKELDARIKAAIKGMSPHLGDHLTIDALRETTATAQRRAETLAVSLSLTPEEGALSLTDLETSEATRSEAVPAAEKSFSDFANQLTQLRTEERAAIEKVQETAKLTADHETRLRILETQIRDLGARYPEGIDPSKTSAQIAFAEAEARVLATEKDLPPDFEKLPERNKRAAASLQQIANELQSRRTDRDQSRAVLQMLGGRGLYSRETEWEERKAGAILRRDAARSQAWCARVAQDLIEHRKQAATKSVLTPLENRLTTAFAELTGDATRQVFLDEHLQIAGIGRTRDETHAFDQLSQGAKEQLLLCLRLAVAQELAADEPQVLILDDVLVNTDPVRQERVLDVLAAQAERLQILILTCHPDRYRGVGQPIAMATCQDRSDGSV
ncbi:MAG: AAA family ATPase [Terrimicrobiaceae bacterium]